MIVKRKSAPKMWKFARNTKKRFAIAAKPGPHAKEKCLTLGHVLRDVFGFAETLHEVRSILNRRIVRVDGRVRSDAGFPLGLMDVLTVGSSHWRVLPGGIGLVLKPISEQESRLKLLKVVNKRHIAGGRVQLNFHDGRNMLVEKDVYKTSDVVLYDLVDRSAKAVVQFKRGSLVLITEGKNCGKLGRVEDVIVLRGPQPNRIVIKHENETIQTLKKFAFAVGQDKPLIAL